MRDLIYNKEKSLYWTNKRDQNELFLRYTILCLAEIYRFRTFIYLNEIYERFGFEWDPSKDNICWYNEMKLIIDYEQIENTPDFIIHIY